MKESINLPNDYVNFSHCYAVTDQHVVIQLKVTECFRIRDLIKIETELNCESTGHKEAHHEAYFKSIWLNSSGIPNRKDVFLVLNDAIALAINNAESDIKSHQQSIKSLTKKIADLKTL